PRLLPLGDRDLVPAVAGCPGVPVGDLIERGRIPLPGLERLERLDLRIRRRSIRRGRAELAPRREYPGPPPASPRLDLAGIGGGGNPRTGRGQGAERS